MIALRLASEGWWGGRLGDVLSAPADEVMLAMQYETFKGEYQDEILRIVKEDAA